MMLFWRVKQLSMTQQRRRKKKSNPSPSNLARAIDAIPKESNEGNANETGDKKLDTEETKKVDGTEKTGVDSFK